MCTSMCTHTHSHAHICTAYIWILGTSEVTLYDREICRWKLNTLRRSGHLVCLWCSVTRRRDKTGKRGELAIHAMSGERWRWGLGVSAPAETGHSKYSGSSKESPVRTKPRSHCTFKIGVSNFWLIFNSYIYGNSSQQEKGASKGECQNFHCCLVTHHSWPAGSFFSWPLNPMRGECGSICLLSYTT